MAAPKPGGLPVPAAIAGPPSAAPGGQVAIPPPPGFTPPPEAAVPAPEPRRDPYAAQQAAVAANLAAFYGRGEPLPGDGDAIKQDAPKAKPWAIVAAALGAGLFMGAVGWAIGNISVSRNDYNITTDHAVRIRDQVEKIHKQVEKVKDALKEIKPTPNDREMPNFAAIEKLSDIDFKEPDITRDLFHTNYFSFEPTNVQQVFQYYNDTTLLSKQLAEHVTRTQKDKDTIEKFVKANQGKQEKPLGVILDYSSKLPLAQLVEIMSPPSCPKPDQTDCPVEDMKMRFRTSLGGEGQLRAVKGAPKDVVFAINPSELQKQMMNGDPGMFAFRDYLRRTGAIVETMRRISETEKVLVEGLKKRANQPKLFAL
ncbi:MAG TPA: hypothetical protein PKI03_20200 [Pseudomonadota bacterium]|nr:hypothetical protein [Pseudomonadota bacterium]